MMSIAAIVSLAAGCAKDIPVESISVEPETLTLAVGETSSLTVTVVPEDADYVLAFTSNDEQVATVSEEGLVEALSDGTATITVKAGNFSATCEVTVIVPTLDVSPSVESVSFEGVRTRTQEFTVTTTAFEWTAEPDADWLSVEYTEGGFILKAAANLSTEESREGSVTISAEGFDPIVIPVSQQEMRMYICGSDNSTACYWLNGVETLIGPEGSSGWNVMQPYSGCNGSASSITVDDTTGDVYFSAYHYYSAPNYSIITVAGYHKNLDWISLTAEEEGTGAQASGIVFQDGNLYIVFQENGVSYYAVNGERHEIEKMDQGNYTSGLFVKDGDVYVAGWYLTEHDGTLIYAPCYWKNGKGVALAVEYANPYSIYVDDEDNVWLAGSKGSGLNRCAAYWKNDEPSVDVLSYENGLSQRIFIVDGNVIMTGCEGFYPNNVVKYWVNGEPTAVTDGSTSCVHGSSALI